MLVIGLTGGIGSGKTTVANMFADLGIEIIDTDILARDVVTPGTTALTHIVEHFGTEILDEYLVLDREKMRGIVFKDPKERQWLENLVHPLIRAKAREHIRYTKSPYVIVVIPLLVELDPNPLINHVLVINATEQQQIERIKNRDQMSEEQIKSIMKAQATQKQRLAIADDIIDNDKDVSEIIEQVHLLHKKYLELEKQIP